MPKKPYRSTRSSPRDNDDRRDKPERSSRDRDDRSSDKPRGNTRYGSTKNAPAGERVERAYRDSERGASRSNTRDGGERKYAPRGDRDDSKRSNPSGKNFSTERNFSKPRYPKRDDERGASRGDDFKSRKPYGDNAGKRFGGNDSERKPYQRRDDNGGERKPFQRRDDDRGERKPYQRRDDRSEGFKRNDDRGERKPYPRRDDDRGERKPFQRNDDKGERYFPKNHPGDVPGAGAPDRRSSHFEKREEDRSRSYNQRKDYDAPPRRFDNDERPEPRERSSFEDRGEPRRDADRNDERGERKPYSDRDDNSSYRKASPNNERYNPRRKDFGGDNDRDQPNRSSYNDRGDDRPKRSSYGDRDNQFKPRGASSYNDRSPNRSFDKPFERKPYGDKPFRDKPSFSDNDRSGFKPRKRISKDENRFDDTPESKEKLAPKTGEDGTLRLNKYIANAGIASRREADEPIAAGEVKVNGKVVTEMGHRVKPDDTITFRGKRVHYGKKVYILMNKPKDYITTTSDERDRKTVMEIIGDATEERVYPVGRLDRNTTGLLLLTNDGELAQKLMHPSYRVRKVYQVTLNKPVTKEDMEKIAGGVELEDGKALVDEVAYADPKDKSIIGIDLHIGKNRIVRRIFESLGYDVINLDRVLYAGMTKKDLPRGKWRFLSEKEIGMLYQNMKRAPKGKPQG